MLLKLIIIFILNVNIFVIISSEVIVNTKNGQIKGLSVKFHNHTINTFTGIRYGESPVGHLRFAKPEPVKPWSGIYDATSFTGKHICWQSNQPVASMSEDCLLLSIWTPSNLSDNNTKTLLPVMFWIHGGGFAAGSGLGFNGVALSANDVIVVSINYRLGMWGYLYGESAEAPGNVGFWDQALALKWAKDNIQSFGGDPNKITIYGESAGAISVATLIVSPITRGLFKRAIIQSGTPYFEWTHSVNSTEIKKINLEWAKKLSKDLGCGDNSNWLSCLKTVDSEKILNHKDPWQKVGFGTIWGDEFMPKTAQEALRSGDFYHGIEILAGVTEDEGTGFLAGLLTTPNYTKEQFHAGIPKLFTFTQTKYNIDALYNYYLAPIDKDAENSLKQAYGRIYGDYLLTCPTHFFAKDFASYTPKNTVYYYHLTHKPENPSLDGGCNQPWEGICHAMDVIYTMGVPVLLPQTYPIIEQNFSRDVMQMWTNFAKTGNPMLPVKVHDTIWPSFRETENSPVVPKAFELNPHKFGDITTDLYKSNCDGLWRPYF